MKYIAALMMLYMAGILPFWLTRYIRGELPPLSSKLSPKKNKFFTLEGNKAGPLPVQDMGGNDGHGPSGPMEALVKNDIKAHSTPVSAVVTAEATATKQREVIADEKMSSTASATTQQTASEFAKTETKELINALNILNASQSLEKTSSIKKAQVTEQKQALIREINARASKGDQMAKKIMEKTNLAEKVSSRGEVSETATKKAEQKVSTEESAKAATDTQKSSSRAASVEAEMKKPQAVKASAHAGSSDVPETKKSASPEDTIVTEKTPTQEKHHEKVMNAAKGNSSVQPDVSPSDDDFTLDDIVQGPKAKASLGTDDGTPQDDEDEDITIDARTKKSQRRTFEEELDLESEDEEATASEQKPKAIDNTPDQSSSQGTEENSSNLSHEESEDEGNPVEMNIEEDEKKEEKRKGIEDVSAKRPDEE
jgi:hypothetical protein